MDRFGTVIIKGAKEHKIVFADNRNIQENDRQLTEVHYVESYKAFNVDISRSGNHSCCILC